MIPRLVCVILLAMAGSASASAQNQPPCSSPEYRQMDFWLGTWDVRWEDAPEFGIKAGNGSNEITRRLGNCVIEENFRGGPTTGELIGHSVSVYHAPLGRWRQTWVDNQGGYFALVGGPEDGRFVLTNSRLSGRAPHLRMVFEDIQADSLTWRWQGSDDGENWSDRWVIRYTRRAAP